MASLTGEEKKVQETFSLEEFGRENVNNCFIILRLKVYSAKKTDISFLFSFDIFNARYQFIPLYQTREEETFVDIMLNVT